MSSLQGGFRGGARAAARELGFNPRGFEPESLGYSPVVAGEQTLQPRRVPRFLAIYLVDHHAGSAAGLDHARHLLSRSSGDAAGDVSRLVGRDRL